VSLQMRVLVGFQSMWTPTRNRSPKPRFPYPVARAALLGLLSAGGLWVGIDLTPPEPRIDPAPPAASRPTPVPRGTPAPKEPQETPPPPPTARLVEGCPDGCDTTQPGCEIKGNISQETGERIFHLPSQRYYGKTIISPERGERWFCTEDEAVANGWRRAKT